MNKQKLISELQSRITKRKESIKYFWKEYEKYRRFYTADRITAQQLGYEQKFDKQLLRQLIVDERELKELREIKYLMYSEY